MIEQQDINDNLGNSQQGGETAVENTLNYNTSSEPLKMPEYGRLVLQMVHFALTIEDRDQRTAYAKKIVRVMGGVNPQMKHVPDFQYKLWDHLAYLSNYQLDVDYPVEIRPYGENTNPNRLSYPGNKIKLRHYGHLVEVLIEELVKLENVEERSLLIVQVADRMRKNLAEWKGDTADDERIARDIARYTDDAVTVKEVMDALAVHGTKHGRR